MKQICLLSLAIILTGGFSSLHADDADGWKTLFDGKTMNGWKPNENVDSWKIVDGALRCKGPRSHLFYVGDDQPFEDFEFECEVMTEPNSNAGIYFHTREQKTGWPKFGYECQVNISHGDPKKSGSLYAVSNVSADQLTGLIEDGKWYKTYIKVEGKRIIIKLNGKTMVDFTEEEGRKAFSKDFERRLGKGTFAFQAHDPQSVVSFRNIKVKRL